MGGGCAHQGAPSASPEAARDAPAAKGSPSPAAPANEASAPATRYRLGDWVLYRFSGAYSEQPVQLCERIVAQDGIKLEIEVTMIRGDEKRRWIQAVTDTPENQKSNALDAVYIVEDGKRRQVPTEHVYKLYDWMLVQLEGKPSEIKASSKGMKFGGRDFTCSVSTGLRVWRGEPARFSFSSCKEFLWTKGPGRIWNPETDKTIFQGEVLRFGRQTRAPGETSTPARSGGCGSQFLD